MPPSTPRKSCLASSSSSSSSDCSSPTNSSLSTTATPPTPLLSTSSYDSPFGTPSRRPKKSVRFANPIREYQIVSATFAVVTEVPEEEEEKRVVETTSKKGRKRKECQSSNMCYMQKTTICPCRYPTCPMYQPPSSSYSPPLLPPPMAPLPKPKKTRQKTQQQPQQGRPFKVDLHMTFNFDESGLVVPPYPSVPALMTSSFTQVKEYAVPAYPGQYHYSPPPYLGTTATYADPYASPPRKLRRKPSFEFNRGGMARSITSSEDSSIEGMRARRGRSNTSESTNSSPLEFADPDDVFKAEEGRWEIEEKYLREMRKRELEKRRLRERRPQHRTDLGGGLAGGTYKDPQTYYADDERYNML